MIRFCTPLILLEVAALLVVVASTPGQAPASKAYLLNVNKGQTFNEIGSDDKTRPELVEDFKQLGGFSPAAQAMLKGLKKYGIFVANNGLEWTLSVAPDSRIPLLHEEFSKIKGEAFEVVEHP